MALRIYLHIDQTEIDNILKRNKVDGLLEVKTEFDLVEYWQIKEVEVGINYPDRYFRLCIRSMRREFIYEFDRLNTIGFEKESIDITIKGNLRNHFSYRVG